MSTISGVSGSSQAWAQMSSNRAQMQAKMFAKVDADSSGGVNQTELQGMLDNVASKTGVTMSSDTTELFSKMDSNGDASLSSDELASGMASILPPPSTMEFAQSRSSTQASDSSSAEKFAALDADGSGTLSKAEMLDIMTEHAARGPGPGQTSAASTDDMFSHLDSDGDGSLSQAEFDAGAPPANGAGNSANSAGVQGAGGPPPGGPRGAGGAGGTESASSTTYDSLDINQDGTVSEAERLIGELAQALSQDSSTGSSSASTDTSQDAALLAKALYEQIAASWSLSDSDSSNSNSTSSLSALA